MYTCRYVVSLRSSAAMVIYAFLSLPNPSQEVVSPGFNHIDSYAETYESDIASGAIDVEQKKIRNTICAK